MAWWCFSMLWGGGGAVIAVAKVYSTCYNRYRVMPWNVPADDSFPGSDELVVSKARYYLIDVIGNVAVAGVVCAALSFGIPRSPWFAVLYLLVGAGGTKALEWGLRLIKIVAADPSLLGEWAPPGLPAARGGSLVGNDKAVEEGADAG